MEGLLRQLQNQQFQQPFVVIKGCFHPVIRLQNQFRGFPAEFRFEPPGSVHGLPGRKVRHGSTEFLQVGSGSAVVGENSIRYIPCVEMPHVADPTGAGDSFVAALSVGLTVGLSQEQALAFASHTAAITVSRMGAMPSLPTLAEVILLLEDRSYDGFQLSALDALK
jgi:hypothetical protein